MTGEILSQNLKKFRTLRGMTQEQAARALNVTAQTVSRWECASTLPDVLMLPEIARLYGVTVDDFYKKYSIAYDNYAQRLASVYEKTLDPEDFLRCILEFQTLMKHGELSCTDKWNYATTYHIMLCDCRDKALEWYDKAIAESAGVNPHVYRRSRSLRNQLLFDLGRGDEVIAQQTAACERTPTDPEEWTCLLEAYMLAENYDQAYSIFQAAIAQFPDNWTLYILGSDICRHLQRYDEALACCDKAGELGTAFYDEYYCRAYCYQAMGEYEQAQQTYMDIAALLRQKNYDVEAEMAEEDALKVRLKAQRA